MINGKKVLGIVTARGGSKGLPGKNIRLLCGKPLIAWTIDAARGSCYIDALILSTDSEEIATVGRKLGVEVPFLRPSELASDTAASVDVIEHAVVSLEAQGRKFEIVVLLEPTSPLREAQDIDCALEKLCSENADFVVSVCSAESSHPAFMFNLSNNGVLTSIQQGGFKALRRQDLTPVYFIEGTVYAADIEKLLATRSFCQENTVGYVVPKWKSAEIDDMIDFLHVEAIMKYKGIA